MNARLSLAAIAVLAASASAQVVEIPSMTTLSSTLTMSAVLPSNPATVPPSPPAVVTNLAALVAAGTNGGAPLAGMTLSPSTAASGLYNTNTQLGRALAINAAGALLLVNPVTLLEDSVPIAVFRAFDATIDLSVRGTEFGVAIGDWSGPMVLEFRNRSDNSLVATHTSSPYTLPDAKFFRVPATFDRVVLRADSVDGNWVIPQLHLQTSNSWEPFGVGCPGSSGTPSLSLVSAPRINSTFSLRVSNMPTGGGGLLMLLGLSNTVASFGPLPYPLDAIGAPGCLLLTDAFGFSVLTHTNGTATHNQPIPNDAQLIGMHFYNQAIVADPGINAAGAVVSDGGDATIR